MDKTIMSDINNFSFKDYFEEGDIIKGFCNGYFGRDDYNDKVVVVVKKDYVLFRYKDYTSLKDEKGYFEIQEYNTLQLSQMINYNSKTEMSCLKSEEFKEMFDEWKEK